MSTENDEAITHEYVSHLMRERKPFSIRYDDRGVPEILFGPMKCEACDELRAKLDEYEKEGPAHFTGDRLDRLREANVYLKQQIDKLEVEIERKDKSFATMQDDVGHLLVALDISEHARPVSPHRVVVDEIIPAIKEMRKERTELALEEHGES